MSIRNRAGSLHYRFNLSGREYAGPTGLAATKQNLKRAKEYEKKKKDEIKAQLQTQDTPSGSAPDLWEAAAEFIVWCQNVEYRRRPRSAERIKVSFASIVEFLGHMRVDQIGAADLERYKTWRIREHGVRDVTLRHDLHALSVFFRKYAIKMHWAAHNPVREISIPSDADAVRIHFITPEEDQRYFQHAFEVIDKGGRRNLYDLTKLMLNQGCRPEEIVALRKTAFDLTTGKLHITGGKTRAATRTLDLTSDSIEILQGRMASDGPWVFPSERYAGRHITKVNNSHDRVCREAAVSFTIYDFRHTFGTRMGAELKIDPFTLASIMGHSNLRTIMRYVHPGAEHRKAAMEKYDAALRRRKLNVMK